MMQRFREALAAVNPSPEGRTWVYVPYDQLNHGIGPLAELDASEAGVVLVETLAKPSRRPYHKQKLALVLANMRHFALEQARRGVAVDYRVGRADTLSQLRGAVQEHGKLLSMRPAERELRAVLAPLVKEHKLVWQEHDGWLTTPDDFREGAGTPDYRMDAFYRHVRQHYDVLMDGTGPVGGRYSFDGDNREPWRGEPEPPTPPRFEVDGITEEVGALFQSFGPADKQPAIEPIVARYPGVKVVLDHIGGAPTDEGDDAPLLGNVLKFAQYPNTYVKFTPQGHKSQEDYPFKDTHGAFQKIYDAFGPQRLMWGTDFPHVIRDLGYGRALDLFREHMDFLSAEDKEWLLGKTALSVWNFGD